MNDKEEARIWVCRDIPGDHEGGPACFCEPQGFTVDELDEGLPDDYNQGIGDHDQELLN